MQDQQAPAKKAQVLEVAATSPEAVDGTAEEAHQLKTEEMDPLASYVAQVTSFAAPETNTLGSLHDTFCPGALAAAVAEAEQPPWPLLLPGPAPLALPTQPNLPSLEACLEQLRSHLKVSADET